MKTLVIAGMLLTLAACNRQDGELIQTVNENAARTDTFNKFNNQIAKDQASLNDWLNGEGKKCAAKGQLKSKSYALQLQQTQVVCIEVPPQPKQPVSPEGKPPAPPAPIPPPPVPAKR